MSYLTDLTRSESVAKLRKAADLLEAGEEKESGKLILDGLGPVAKDLRRTYGPIVRIVVSGWIRKVFEE